MNLKQRYLWAVAIADRTSTAIRDRARRVALEAGLDPAIPGLHARNAIISRDAGRPWPEVDYSKARLVLRLLERSHEPHRIVTAWCERTKAI